MNYTTLIVSRREDEKTSQMRVNIDIKVNNTKRVNNRTTDLNKYLFIQNRHKFKI